MSSASVLGSTGGRTDSYRPDGFWYCSEPCVWAESKRCRKTVCGIGKRRLSCRQTFWPLLKSSPGVIVCTQMFSCTVSTHFSRACEMWQCCFGQRLDLVFFRGSGPKGFEQPIRGRAEIRWSLSVCWRPYVNMAVLISQQLWTQTSKTSKYTRRDVIAS